MMLKIFIVYFAIGLFLTIKVGRDDFVRWVDEDHLPMLEVVMTAIGISLIIPIVAVYEIIMGIVGIFKRDYSRGGVGLKAVSSFSLYLEVFARQTSSFMRRCNAMYLDNYDHKVLNVAADIISKKAGVSKTRARMMMFWAIDDSEFKDFVINLCKKQNYIIGKDEELA